MIIIAAAAETAAAANIFCSEGSLASILICPGKTKSIEGESFPVGLSFKLAFHAE